jgi:hypothetical protein
MRLISPFLFMQVLAKAANGAAIGSTFAASSYLSRMHREKGDLLNFFKKGDENSVLGRLETLRNYLKNTENRLKKKKHKKHTNKDNSASGNVFGEISLSTSSRRQKGTQIGSTQCDMNLALLDTAISNPALSPLLSRFRL